MKTIVMSVGGSLIAPDVVDLKFLKQFKKLILDFTKAGNRVVIICGGGNTARVYQKSARALHRAVKSRDLDWVGIAATKLNAELVSAMFGDASTESIIHNPNKMLTTNKKIVIGAGFEPGHSTDMDAVLLARAYGAKIVINLSNITYVYNKDPRKFKNAKPMPKMTWPQFQKLVGTKWTPGAHKPFDPIATKLAASLRMKLVVMKGSDLKNLKAFLAGKKFKGTIVQ